MERINFGRVGAWRALQPGHLIPLPGGKRDVVIAFATSGPTPLVLISEGSEPIPLGIVNGIAEYTIKVMGDVEISPTTEEVIAFRTQDGQGVAYQTDAVPFVGMMERKTRNLAEERIAFVAMQNGARRARQMEESLVGMAAMLEQLRAAEDERSAAAAALAAAAAAGDGATPSGVAE